VNRFCVVVAGGALTATLMSIAASADPRPSEFPQRALRSTVRIEVEAADGRKTVASGVVLRIHAGVALVATARHVVDSTYFVALSSDQIPCEPNRSMSVVTLDPSRAVATLEWLAPHGIDLALLSAPLSSATTDAAQWDRAAPPQLGAEVFSVGDPLASGWQPAGGKLTQIRNQEQERYPFQLLQSDMRLRPGNSGGGLYDAAGRLLAIHSMTGIFLDAGSPGGRGLSTALPCLLDLAPAEFALRAKSPRNAPVAASRSDGASRADR